MSEPLISYTINQHVNHRITVEAANADEALKKALETPLEKWDDYEFTHTFIDPEA